MGQEGENEMTTTATYGGKLTDEDVKLIRECRAEYERLMREAQELSADSLAKKFGVTRSTIHRALAKVDLLSHGVTV